MTKKVIETTNGWYMENEKEKVELEDIIGLIKTDEPTDSVQLKKEAQLSICEKRVLELEEENEQLKQQLTDCKEKKQQMKEFLYRNKAKGLPKDEVKETLQKRYNHLQKIQQETEKPSRYWQGAIMEIEVIADCLGVELK